MERARFKADWDGLIAAERWVGATCDMLRIAGDLKNGLQVCFEELSTNVVRHGVEAEGQWFDVTLGRDGASVLLRVADNAPPFDTAAAIARITDPLSDGYRIGGLGLGLVGKIAHGIAYRRMDGVNETTLTFALPAAEADTPADSRLN